MGMYCTIHQVVKEDGQSRVVGSEVRLPSGEVIPGVQRIEVVAEPGFDSRWVVTIQLEASFGEPIR